MGGIDMNRPIIIGAFVLVLLGGCVAPQHVRQIDRLEAQNENPRILLMQPDVKYYLNTAGGVLEPQAEWTEAARGNFRDATIAFGEQRNADIVQMQSDATSADLELTYDNLHSAVGSAIMSHYYGLALPTKNGGFDWTLGTGVAALGEKYDADYALFAFYRDIEATGGRWAMSILSSAVLGVGLSTEAQYGFASLVDLRTGDVVWFNRVLAGAGDLRSQEGAATVVVQLFSEMPGG
jgi:hypothetical protein